MPEEDITISGIVRQLPIRFQNRFESLSGYVRALIYEEEERLQRDIRLTNDDIQLIQLAALVYSLDWFFRTGSQAAAAAARTFEGIGLSGFSVGNTIFTSGNANTWRGARLAAQLRGILADTRVGGMITHSLSMRDLVTTMIREIG